MANNGRDDDGRDARMRLWGVLLVSAFVLAFVVARFLFRGYLSK